MAAPVAAVKAAAAFLTDKKMRTALLSVITGIAAVIILPFIMVISILTMPFEALGDAFSGDEYDQIVALRNVYGFDQYLHPNDESYLESAGQNFSGVSFTDGATEVVYYNQLDARWAEESYGKTGTIGSSGCGPTALAIVVSSLTNQKIDPVQMSRWSYENGYRAEGNGSYLSLIPNGAGHFGLAVETATTADAQKIVDALADGKLIVAIMSAGHFTKGGHFIVLRGVTSEGKILVADPASKSRSEQEWDLSVILNEARKDVGAPFWICSA